MYKYLVCLLVSTSFLLSQEDLKNISKNVYLWQYKREGISQLQELLKHQNSDVRRQSVIALGRIQDRTSISTLVSSLQDSDVEVRVQAAFALGQMWDEESESHLLSAVEKEKNPQVMAMLIEALGKVGGQKTMAIFAKWLAKDQWEKDVAYASGLLAYRGVLSSDLIRKLIHTAQHSKEARIHVSYALMRAKEPRSANYLIQLLYDKNADCRMNAARALGYLKTNAALPHLQLVLYDRDARVVVNALNALQGFTDIKTEHMAALLKHKNAHVVLTCIRVIGNFEVIND